MLVSKSIEVCPTPVFFSKLLSNQSLIPNTCIDKTFSSVMEFQAALEQFKLYTKQARKMEIIYVILSILCGVGALWAMMMAFALPSSLFLKIFSIFLFAAIIAMHIVGQQWNQLKQVEASRYKLPKDLSDLLSRDMSKEAPLKVRIDFSTPYAKKKQIDKAPYPSRRGWTQTTFTDPWLCVSGRFLDNTIFTITVTQQVVIRAGYKRGSSGKSKFKRKRKRKGSEATLELKFPRKKYGAVKILQSDMVGAIKLAQIVTLKRLSMNERRLSMTVKIPALSFQPWIPYRTIAQMLLSAYQVLNLSKELSKQSA